MQPPLYHLDIDHDKQKEGTLAGDKGITGTKMGQTARDAQYKNGSNEND